MARAKPGGLNFGSGGVGTPVHMAGELLKVAAKIDIVHIPYKGAGPAFIDLLGGHFQMMFPTLQSAVPHIKSGRLRLLALTTEKRSQAFPDTPTMEEAGFPGVIAVAWFGIHAPRANAESNRRAPACRGGQGTSGPHGEATLRNRRRRHRRQHARAVLRVRGERDHEVEQGCQGSGHQT